MFDLPSSSTFAGGNNFSRPGSGFGGPGRGPMLGRAASSSTSSLVGIGAAAAAASAAVPTIQTVASGAVDKSNTNLIVNYIPQDMTERELFGLFTPFGPIESCKIMRDLKVSVIFSFFTFLFIIINVQINVTKIVESVTRGINIGLLRACDDMNNLTQFST